MAKFLVSVNILAKSTPPKRGGGERNKLLPWFVLFFQKQGRNKLRPKKKFYIAKIKG